MTRKNYLPAFSIVIVLTLGIVGMRAHNAEVTRQQSADIYEAVLRYLVEGIKTNAKYHGRTVTRAESLAFVLIDGKDPSAGFLRRFETGIPEILPASRGVSDNNPDIWKQRTIDKQTKRRGTLLVMGHIEWQSASSASVEVQFPGHSSFYFLQKQNEKWQVIKSEGGTII